MTENIERAAETATEILIIDDSPTQNAQLQYLLEKQGFVVMTAGNGMQALTWLAGNKPALIISDIIMPGMNGFELCKKIKEDERLRDVPIIILTLLSDPLDVIKGLECGADNFLTKPCDEKYLLTRIQQILANTTLREMEPASLGVEITLSGEKYLIKSDRIQILNLLLSSYETAIQKNRELTRMRDELNELNEQLKAANGDLEAFSYTISHDLRGPLNNIHGSCHVIEELYADTLDPQCRKFFRHISAAGKKMDKMISTILKFSQLSRQELQREQVDLSSMVKAIVVGFRFNEPQRQVTFNTTDGIVANGDLLLLQIVLENLLSNAWKYTSTKENVVIEFGMLEYGGIPAYFVRDNGVGFDMAGAGGLFAPFQRLHEAEEFEGFGIGLSTVQRIVQRHGGRAWAEGEAGKGAVFYFTLNP